MKTRSRPAPELITSHWLNTEHPLSLAQLRGKVVVIEAFQMLCPGCVSHGVPQINRVHDTFPADQLQVIGLHTVFEHHEAMTPLALQAFIHEYRIRFPVAVDQPGEEGPVPQTMARYQMQGTPTLILIDRQGNLRKQHFGMESDLRLGAEIMTLINETQSAEHDQGEPIATAAAQAGNETCDDQGCSVQSA